MNIEYIRSLVRPVVTFLFVAGYIYMALTGIKPPPAYTTTMGMVLVFYFKSRDEVKKQ